VLTETQLVFYYGGFDLKHWQRVAAPWSSAIGRASMRRDGFSSWDNLPGRTGTVESQPLLARGADLWLYADPRAGQLRVEVRDEGG